MAAIHHATPLHLLQQQLGSHLAVRPGRGRVARGGSRVGEGQAEAGIREEQAAQESSRMACHEGYM